MRSIGTGFLKSNQYQFQSPYSYSQHMQSIGTVFLKSNQYQFQSPYSYSQGNIIIFYWLNFQLFIYKVWSLVEYWVAPWIQVKLQGYE